MILLFLAALALLVYLIYRHFNVFEERGVPYLPFTLSNFLRFRSDHVYKLYCLAYEHIKPRAGIGGFFINFTPFFLATDPELIKAVLIKDFGHFVNRGMFFNERTDPVGASLFSLEGEKWKNLRAKLTPTFTSGKIKGMFPAVLKISDEFNRMVVKESTDDSQWHLKGLLGKFTADVIGTCAFGLECNGLTNPDNQFVNMGLRIFRAVRVFTMLNTLKMEYRSLFRLIGCRRFPEPVTRFYHKVVSDTVEYREKNKVDREDFMNTLIKMKNLKDDEGLTLDEIVAQSVVFFAAGFETTANTLNYIFYNLAIHPEMQDKVRDEVQGLMEKHDNQLTYEVISETVFLDKFIMGK